MVSLDIRFCRNITDEGLSKLTKLSRLQDLKVDHLRKITSAGLAQTTQKCPNLKKLSMANCLIDNLEIVLKPLSNLIALDVRSLFGLKTSSWDYKSVDENLACISSLCPNLESLSLANVKSMPIIDELVASLPKVDCIFNEELIV